MKLIIVGFLGATILLGACRKGGDSSQEAAVRAAVEAYLQKRNDLALNKMEMQIKDVKVNGDKADAQVRFSSKENAQLAVTIQYSLNRAGDHWEVASSTPVGGDSHQSTGMPMEGGANPHGGAAPPQSPAPEASH